MREIVWGASGAAIGIVGAMAATLAGQHMPGNLASFAMAGLFWGFVCCKLRYRGLNG